MPSSPITDRRVVNRQVVSPDQHLWEYRPTPLFVALRTALALCA